MTIETIEWTTTEPRPPRVVRRELQVYEVANGERADRRRAAPADLVAALAAMPLGDRETVLSASWNGIVMRGDYEHMVEERNEATARAARAERERDRMAAEFGCCPGEIPDDGEIARVVRERAEFRDRAEKAERERDEARLDLDRARASLDVVRHDLAGTRQELREAREDRDSLRARLIAAESAAAAREPDARGCSYTDAVTLFRRDPSASWTCDELQKNHGPDARCRFSQEEARMMFAHPGGFYSGPYTPTRAEALATDWRRVEAKTEAARPPREYPLAEGSPPPSIDPARLDLVRRALSGYVDPDQSPEQAARVAVEVADAALAIMRGLL